MRNYKKEIIEEFKLGYVPSKNNFYNDLSKKYSEEGGESGVPKNSVGD